MTAIDHEIKELVIARLQTLPDDTSISIGAEGTYSKEELLAHVAGEDPVGEKIVEVEMNFLRNLKEGTLYE